MTRFASSKRRTLTSTIHSYLILTVQSRQERLNIRRPSHLIRLSSSLRMELMCNPRKFQAPILAQSILIVSKRRLHPLTYQLTLTISLLFRSP